MQSASASPLFASVDDCLDQARRISGWPVSSIEPLYTVAHHLFGQARYDDALRLFAILVTLNACDARFQNGMGACKQMQHRLDEAMQHYAVATLLDMTDPQPLLHWAECLLSLGQRGEALEKLHFALGHVEAFPRHASLGPRVRGLIALLDEAHPRAPAQAS
jgi:type III secretion system low calcium response chaperone LcrH/SycD